MSSILDGLNEAQRAAVTSDAEVMQILAPPGSGKTKTLTSRVAYLLHHCGYKPWNIICLTFTIKSAQEMRERVSKILGDAVAKKLILGTFHSVCRRYLVSYGHFIGIQKGFGIADTTDTLGILKRITKRLNLTTEAKTAQARISRTKSKGLTCDDIARDERTQRHQDQREFLTIFEEYQKQLTTSNLLDYDDLLVRCGDLLREHPECVANVEAVLIDEFQDTNRVQFDLMMSFATRQKRITTVGDMDQSIYGWRSAEIKNLERMQERYPDTLVMHLQENYRSSGAILLCANEVIDQDPSRPQKSMMPTHCPGTMPVLRKLPSADAEASWIVSEIQRSRALTGGLLALYDFAILLRTASLSRLIEASLGKAGIPYRMVGGHKFYDRAEIKVLLDYLRVISLPTNTDAITRAINVPARGVGDVSVKSLLEHADVSNTTLWVSLKEAIHGSSRPGSQPPKLSSAAKKGIDTFMGIVLSCQARLRSTSNPASPGDLLQLIIRKLNFKSYLEKISKEDHEARWSNVEELLSQASDSQILEQNEEDKDALPELEGIEQSKTNASEDALIRFLANIALTSEVQKEKDDAEGEDTPPDHQVTISTIHAAKGLEWPVVFVPSAYQGCIPHSRAEDMDEERRLLYVAMTRAQAMLYLSCPHKNSNREETNLSSFLAEKKVQHILGNQGPAIDSVVVDDVARILRRDCPTRSDIAKTARYLESLEDNKWSLDGSESAEVIQARLARYAEGGPAKSKNAAKRPRLDQDSNMRSVNVGYTTTMETASAFSCGSNVGFTTASVQMKVDASVAQSDDPPQAQKKAKGLNLPSQRNLLSLWGAERKPLHEPVFAEPAPRLQIGRQPTSQAPPVPPNTANAPAFVKINDREPLLPLPQSRQLPRPKAFGPIFEKSIEEATRSNGYLFLSSSSPPPENVPAKEPIEGGDEVESRSQADNVSQTKSYMCPTSMSTIGNAPRKTLGVRRTMGGWSGGGKGGFSVPMMRER